MKKIGKIIATEKVPTTVDEFYFWTDKHLIIKPFDVVKVQHIKNSVTFGVVEEKAGFHCQKTVFHPRPLNAGTEVLRGM